MQIITVCVYMYVNICVIHNDDDDDDAKER